MSARRSGIVLMAAAIAAWCGAGEFTADFEQADGAPRGWHVVHPTAAVRGGALFLTPAGAGEPQALAGIDGEPLWFDEVRTVEFDIAFTGSPPAWPYDHGGIVFCLQSPHDRWAASGYLVDYLDGHFRIIKMVKGAHTEWSVPGITAYEGRWRVTLDETRIVFYHDDDVKLVVNDVSYRGGYVGVYAYTNAGQELRADNLLVEYEAGACPAAWPEEMLLAAGGEAALNVRIPTLANAAADYRVTVASDAPAVAAPAGHTGGALVVTFPAGGPCSRAVPIKAFAPGIAALTVRPEGGGCDLAAAWVEVRAEKTYAQDFTADDGPFTDWFIAGGGADIVDQRLLVTPSFGVEAAAWVGIDGMPIDFDEPVRISFTIEFPGAPTDWIGDHGGIMFNCTKTTNRWRNPGYTIDFFENHNDPQGPCYRILRSQDTADTTQQQIGLATRYVTACDPNWTITFTSDGFIFEAGNIDPVTIVDPHFADLNHGYVGFWCYWNEGQQMTVDDLNIVVAANPCLKVEPREAVNHPANAMTAFTVVLPFGANFEGDVGVTVRSTHPEIAAPLGSANGELVLLFERGTAAARTFLAECKSPGTTEFLLSAPGFTCVPDPVVFTVRPPGAASFEDDFAQADGAPEQWTPYAGLWEVFGGQLSVLSPSGGPEAWLWAGSPPLRFDAVDKIALTLALDNDRQGTVGRHGGVMVCADDPTERWRTSGYGIDWIEWLEAGVWQGAYRLLRYERGAEHLLQQIPWDLAALGTRWEIEFDGTLIALWVDGENVFEYPDDAFREGYAAVWAYSSGTLLAADDVVIGQGTEIVTFKRGDTNADGRLNIADAICLLGYLFGSQDDQCKTGVPKCLDSADANDDGKVDVADAVKILGHLFTQTGPLPPPFEACGRDPTDDPLGCESFRPCL
mgnify:FL=1